MAPVRSELLDVLQRISELNPNVRMGQLIENTFHFFGWERSPTLYDLEDADLLAGLRQHLENLESRATDDQFAPVASA